MGTIPASWRQYGYVSAEQAVKANGSKFRRLMIGTDGATNTGKTEFALSCPGPGICHVLDKNVDGVLSNPAPPTTRNRNFVFNVCNPPMWNAASQNEFQQYWASFRDGVYRSLAVPEARTIVIDGDSDSWEIQRVAEFGKLAQVPGHLYVGVNAARRAFISRLWSSGKIIIATNKLKKEYETVMDDKGNPVVKDGKEQRAWTGQYERQGFADHEYLWQIQLTHLYKPTQYDEAGNVVEDQEWGARITMCKANRSLEGDELWNSDCNFRSLVKHVYPHISMDQWGL